MVLCLRYHYFLINDDRSVDQMERQRETMAKKQIGNKLIVPFNIVRHSSISNCVKARKQQQQNQVYRFTIKWIIHKIRYVSIWFNAWIITPKNQHTINCDSINALIIQGIFRTKKKRSDCGVWMCFFHSKRRLVRLEAASTTQKIDGFWIVLQSSKHEKLNKEIIHIQHERKQEHQSWTMLFVFRFIVDAVFGRFFYCK